MNFEKYNIFTPYDLMNFFEKNLKYGFTYRGVAYTDEDENFQEKMNEHYKIRLDEDFIKSGYGVCWDFCELERQFFIENKIPHECFFIESCVKYATSPTHTFCLFQNGDKNWCWFEYSWANEKGIKEYKTKEEALQDVVKRFREYCECFGQLAELKIYKTRAITKRMDFNEFIDRCREGELIEDMEFEEDENEDGFCDK